MSCICDKYKENRELPYLKIKSLKYVGKLYSDLAHTRTIGAEAYQCSCGEYWSTYGHGAGIPLALTNKDYLKDHIARTVC